MYVTDNFKITFRRGPGTQYKIIQMLPSGTKLNVLEEKSNWLKVKTTNGNKGWILKRYTMKQLPKSTVVENLNQRLQNLKQQNQNARNTISALKSENQELKNKPNQTQKKLNEIKNEYSTLLEDARNIKSLKENYESTKKKLSAAQTKLDRLSTENQELRSKVNMQWFIAGGSLVFISAFVGFLLGRIQRKKSKKFFY